MSSPLPAARTAEHPRPRHTLLHISDTHLVAGNAALHGTVDADSHLKRLFAEMASSRMRPDAIVFTGDLADKGEQDAYRKLRGIVEPAAASLGAEVIWVMGNHDDRATLRTELLGEQATTRPLDAVHDLNGLRIVVLDTTVPGHHHGQLRAEQLDWLREVLAEPAPYGTLLALHHPPVPCVLDLAVLVELRDQRALAEVLAGTDVRSILAGHLHYSTTAGFAGIPVSVASATCYTQDLNVEAGGMRSRDGAQSFNLVQVYDHTVMHTVVPVGGFRTLSQVSPDEVTQQLSAAGVRIPDSDEATGDLHRVLERV